MRRSETAATVGRNGNCPISHCSKRETEQSDGSAWNGNQNKTARAPALEGKANAALLGFLAERLKIPARAIVLERGDKSREKVIRIEGLSEENVRCRLLPII
jgi:uncharacterized protein (TIGR00251 family)